MNQLLLDRPKSGFPVSIGTGLSLESILDPVIEIYDENREVTKIEKSKYNSLLFNVSTIVRNLVSSLHTDDISKINLKEYYEAVREEIEYISDLFALEDIQTYFYTHSYKYPKTRYQDKLRIPNTPKQIEYNNILEYCLTNIAKSDTIYNFDAHIKIDNKMKSLIFTHIPWDLLSMDNFLELHLIESHTGLVKTKKEFNSKYFKIPNVEMNILPFNEQLLTVLGDHVMFKPSPLQKRLELYNMLSDKNVNALTSNGVLDILLGKYFKI